MKKLFLLFTIGLLFIGCKYSPSLDINDENITYIEDGANKFVSISYPKTDLNPKTEFTITFYNVSASTSNAIKKITINEGFTGNFGFNIINGNGIGVKDITTTKKYVNVEFFKYKDIIITKYICKNTENTILSSLSNEHFLPKVEKEIDCSMSPFYAPNYTRWLSESEHFYIYLVRTMGSPYDWYIQISEKVNTDDLYSKEGDWIEYDFYNNYERAKEYFLEITQSN